MPRPQRVTRELVLSAAMELVEEEGVDALTMRRLGERVGADPAMVYRMFRGKNELLESMADAVFSSVGGELAAPLPRPDYPEDDWRAAVHQLAHRVRAALLAHPALIGLAVRRPPKGEATYRGMDAGLGLLMSAGLPPREAALGYQAVLFYTLGFAALEAPFAATPDGGAAQQAETHRSLAELPREQFPHIAATAEHLYGPDLTAQFDHGLRLMIAGLGRLDHEHD